MNRLLLLVMTFFCVLILSCHSNNLDAKYCSNHFNSPDSLIMLKMDYEDDYYGLSAEYKIIVYYDSMCCTPCVMNNLIIWNNIVVYSENNPDRLSLVFVFSPNSELKSVFCEMMSSKNPLCYPIFVDLGNEMHELNEWLPKGLFVGLLNKENTVVAAGNPIHLGTWERFLSIIEH